MLLVAFADDGAERRTNRPLRFVSSGVFRVERSGFRATVGQLIDAVLEQLRGVDSDDVAQLATDWAAVLSSTEEEPELCRWTAQLGLDPYDPSQLDDQLVEFFETSIRSMSDGLRNDSLDASNSSTMLKTVVSWLDDQPALTGLDIQPKTVRLASMPMCSAHETGYAAARALRAHLGMSATDTNILSTAGDHFGFTLGSTKAVTGAMPASLSGMVGALTDSGEQAPVLLLPPLPHEEQTFAWGRALYLWATGAVAAGPRLLTGSHARIQREGRAFAAELLAPAAFLRQELGGRPIVGERDIQRLAKDHALNPALVRHQIENHSIAETDLE